MIESYFNKKRIEVIMEKIYILLYLVFSILVLNNHVLAQEGDIMPTNIVVFETNKGDIEIQLKPEVAPKACENFIGLVNKGYYDGIVFHRVIKGFMVQGGDPTATGAGGESIWGESFEDEFSDDETFDKKGILAMANAGPGTNGSQFFITTAPTPWLDGRHTIFGEVISGYDVVEEIENTQTGVGDRPVDDQMIVKASMK